jgi:hypothetical protein
MESTFFGPPRKGQVDEQCYAGFAVLVMSLLAFFIQ